MKKLARLFLFALGTLHWLPVYSDPVVLVRKNSSTPSALSLDLAGLSATRLGETVTFDLGSRQQVRLLHDRREVMPSGNIYWSGYIVSQGHVYRTDIAFSEDAADGVVRTVNGNYHLAVDARGARITEQPMTDAACGNGDTVEPFKTGTQKAFAAVDIDGLIQKGDTSAEPATIDVLLLYSQGVANEQGSNLQIYLDRVWGAVRAKYSASDTRVDLRVVAQSAVQYRTKNLLYASGDVSLSEMVSRIPGFHPTPPFSQSPPAGLANVFEMRVNSGADLVVLLMHSTDMDENCVLARNCPAAGYANEPNLSGWKGSFEGSFPNGYAVVETGISDDYIIAHEIGHTLGGAHERPFCTFGLFDHSCPIVNSNGVGTIMKANGPWYAVFSNPALNQCDGPCGIPSGDPKAADNARTFRKSRFVVAEYRPTKVDAGLGDLTGMWWNPQESGWGVGVTQRADKIFAAWYTYDSTGKPKWYVASNCHVVNSTCAGLLYEVSYSGGLATPNSAFDSRSVQVSHAGVVTFAFSAGNKALMTYTVRGVSKRINIERLVVRDGGATGVYDWNGLWWNSNESGWGLSISQQFDVLFAVVYSYDAEGRPVWYVASACTLTSSRDGCTGDLYSTSGPGGPESNLPFQTSAVQVKKVGTFNLTFSTPDVGSVSYTVNGSTVVRSISRQLF